MSALYLHIPFCKTKCHYCSFGSWAGQERLFGDYLLALKKEVGFLAKKYGRIPLATVFVGGGTPTCLPSALLCDLIDYCLSVFGLEPGAEVSIEANPGTVDGDYFQKLLSSGVNRLSFGVQSFNEEELKTLGRSHTARDAEQAVELARGAGFTNINLDLMYGLPAQSAASWRSSLERGLALNPDHLSLYQLSVEEGTPFYKKLNENVIVLPTESVALDMDAHTLDLCGSAGFIQYEISNYSLPGMECRHNINYWRNQDYLAAGAAAVSYLGGVRQKRVGSPLDYISRSNSGESPVTNREQLSIADSFRETVIMGLRMVEGVGLDALQKRYGIEIKAHYGADLQNLIDHGFVALTDTHLKITPKGWPLSNQVMAALV